MGILWASFSGKLSFPRNYRHFIFVSNECWQYVVTQTCENKLSNAPMSNLFSKFRKISSNGANDCAWVENCGRIQPRVEMSNGQCPFIHNERSLRVFLVWLTLTWITCFNSRWRNISRLKNQTVSHPQGLRIHIPLWRRILGQFCTESNINRKMRRGRGRGGNVGERFRPNVFLAIYVNNPILVAGISEVQDECVRRQPRLAPHRDAVPAARSHVSLLAARWNRSIWKLENKTSVC